MVKYFIKEFLFMILWLIFSFSLVIFCCQKLKDRPNQNQSLEPVKSCNHKILTKRIETPNLYNIFVIDTLLTYIDINIQ